MRTFHGFDKLILRLKVVIKRDSVIKIVFTNVLEGHLLSPNDIIFFPYCFKNRDIQAGAELGQAQPRLGL